ELSKSDVDRANEVARAQPVPQDRELLHAIPQEYSVDKNQGIRDPIGMIGTRLETEMYLGTIGASPAMNLRKSVERAGYHVRELVLEPLASALSVLTEDEKALGVALVEVGAGTTDIAVFHEGTIRYLGTVNYGGNNVTSDIVQGLGVTQAAAVVGTGGRSGSPSEDSGGLAGSVEAPRFSTVVGVALYGAHRSAAGFAPSGRHRALAGAGVARFTKRIKTWLEDFF